MKLTKLAIALALTSSASLAHAVDASDVTLSNGGNVETAINQVSGQIAGLGSDVVTLYSSKVDKTAQTTRDAGQDAAIHETYVLANTKYTEAAGKFLESRVDGHDNAIADLGAGIEQLNTKTDATNSRVDDVSMTAQTAKGTADRAAMVNLDQDQTLADHESRITDNAAAIETKVGKDDYAKDKAKQARTDDVQTGQIEVTNQRIDEDRSHITANKAAQDQVNADQAVTDGAQDALIGQARKHALQNQEAIAAETDQRGKADDALDNKITQTNQTVGNESAARQAVDKQQGSALADHDSRITKTAGDLKTEVTNRVTQFNALQTDVAQAQATGEYAHSRIDAANQNIQANRDALTATNKRVSQNTADIANHEQRITGLEQSTNSKFADLNKRVDDNRKRASAGIAGVAAMANIPQVLEHQTFAIGAGAGNTDGESALAVGFSARASQNTVVKASVSNDTQHNFVVGAGVSYGW